MMIIKIARLIATFFYAGIFPVASGTFASAVAVLIVLDLYRQPWLYVAVMIVVTVVGIWASGVTEKAVGKKDPSIVVIDEVAGVMVSFFLVPLSWPVVLSGFFLFRAFDMFKIYPCNKLEEQGGGWGIMADDLFAGLYTNIVLQLAVRLAAGS
jgi:phosphatidylglycerophosphatase A